MDFNVKNRSDIAAGCLVLATQSEGAINFGSPTSTSAITSDLMCGEPPFNFDNYAIKPDESKPCACGKKMVSWYSSSVLTSAPPMMPWYWRCACGSRESGGIERGNILNPFMEKWKKANGQTD